MVQNGCNKYVENYYTMWKILMVWWYVNWTHQYDKWQQVHKGRKRNQSFYGLLFFHSQHCTIIQSMWYNCWYSCDKPVLIWTYYAIPQLLLHLHTTHFVLTYKRSLLHYIINWHYLLVSLITLTPIYLSSTFIVYGRLICLLKAS